HAGPLSGIPTRVAASCLFSDFFFQAEDGIRARNVTGVQTCALPIFKIIDKNQLYYNYSEIDDENVRDLIEDNDYAFNESFYDKGGEYLWQERKNNYHCLFMKK